MADHGLADKSTSFNNRVCAKCGLNELGGNPKSYNTQQPDKRCSCEEPDWQTARVKATKNTHPTVKPIRLMEYLIRLVTPPGGRVLDPFAGSGTTVLAARRLGFQGIGIEIERESFDIACLRLTNWEEIP